MRRAQALNARFGSAECATQQRFTAPFGSAESALIWPRLSGRQAQTVSAACEIGSDAPRTHLRPTWAWIRQRRYVHPRGRRSSCAACSCGSWPTTPRGQALRAAARRAVALAAAVVGQTGARRAGAGGHHKRRTRCFWLDRARLRTAEYARVEAAVWGRLLGRCGPHRFTRRSRRRLGVARRPGRRAPALVLIAVALAHRTVRRRTAEWREHRPRAVVAARHHQRPHLVGLVLGVRRWVACALAARVLLRTAANHEEVDSEEAEHEQEAAEPASEGGGGNGRQAARAVVAAELLDAHGQRRRRRQRWRHGLRPRRHRAAEAAAGAVALESR
eukprot:1078202-Pleurochrysis_carterae.AAC.3